MLMNKILKVLKNARSHIDVLGSPTDEVNIAQLAEIDSLIKKLTVANPSKDGFFYWVIQFGVHKEWVADGIDFTDYTAHKMLATYYGHLYGHELKAKVLSSPPDENVAKEMGFTSIAEYIKDRKEER